MSIGPELTVAAIQTENSRKRKKGKEKKRGTFQVFVLSFTRSKTSHGCLHYSQTRFYNLKVKLSTIIFNYINHKV